MSSTLIDVNNLRQTKWVMGWKKIRFSWKSKVTFMERPNRIHWESTSGLKNMGTIIFEEQSSDDEIDNIEENYREVEEIKTKMTLTLKFIAPRIVAGMMKRSDKIATFMEGQILQPTLIKFRDIVMDQDLGIEGMDVDVVTDVTKKTTGSLLNTVEEDEK